MQTFPCFSMYAQDQVHISTCVYKVMWDPVSRIQNFASTLKHMVRPGYEAVHDLLYMLMKVKDLFCMYIIRVCGCELSTSRPPLISTCILLFPSRLCDYCSVKSYSCKPSADIHGLHSQYLENSIMYKCGYQLPAHVPFAGQQTSVHCAICCRYWTVQC